jgi:hypothetical protein
MIKEQRMSIVSLSLALVRLIGVPLWNNLASE